MNDQRTSVSYCLSERFSSLLTGVPDRLWRTVHEIRLRVGMPLCLVTSSEQYPFGEAITPCEIYDMYLRCCGRAVHAHEEELRQGFVTTRDGCRVGIGGTAVVKSGDVTAYRDITSLCIRIPRHIDGCASPLMSSVKNDSGIVSTLICGAPSCGKTTLLRDIAKQLASSFQICVVDERFELSSGGLYGVDVLRGCPKAVGILQAIRTLSPDAVVVDELGDEREWEAVMRACHCGVPVIASAHMVSRADVAARPLLAKTIERGGFGSVIFLPPRGREEKETTVWKARDVLAVDGNCAYRVRLRGGGVVAGGRFETDTAALECVDTVS